MDATVTMFVHAATTHTYTHIHAKIQLKIDTTSNEAGERGNLRLLLVCKYQ